MKQITDEQWSNLLAYAQWIVNGGEGVEQKRVSLESPLGDWIEKLHDGFSTSGSYRLRPGVKTEIDQMIRERVCKRDTSDIFYRNFMDL